jgi:hypothetical protein
LYKSIFQQIDETPLDGKVFDREALEELSKEGVTLVSHPDLFYFIFMLIKCIQKEIHQV